MIQAVLDSAKYHKLCWWACDLLFWDAAVEIYQKWLGKLRGKEVGT